MRVFCEAANSWCQHECSEKVKQDCEAFAAEVRARPVIGARAVLGDNSILTTGKEKAKAKVKAAIAGRRPLGPPALALTLSANARM